MSKPITLVFNIEGLEGYSSNHMYYQGVRRGGRSAYKSKSKGYMDYQGIFVNMIKDWSSRLSESDLKLVYDYLTKAEYEGANLHAETTWTYELMRTSSGNFKKKDSSNLLKTIEDSLLLAFNDEVVIDTLKTYGSNYDDRHHNLTTTRKLVGPVSGQAVAITTGDIPFSSISQLVSDSSRSLLVNYLVDYYKVETKWHYKLYRIENEEKELVLDTNV